MGICASSNLAKDSTRMKTNSPSTAKVIHLDGSHQGFRHSIEARHVLSQNPGCFLCCSESIYVHSPAPHVPADEELKLGEIYFLMPISKSEIPLSLQDLGSLASKAISMSPLSYGGDDVSCSSKSDGCCRNPADVLYGANFRMAHGSQGNYPVL